MKKKIVALFAITTLMITFSSCDLLEEKKKFETSINIDENTASDAQQTQQKEFDAYGDEEVKEKVEEIQGYIDDYFYFEKDSAKQEEAYYDGIMAGLDDPYSVYYTAEEYQELLEEDSGEFSGVGAVVTQDENKNVKIVRTIKNSPAQEAGLEADDIIVQVGDVEINGQDLDIVVKMIRGEVGTVAHIKVYRQSVNDYLEFDITRAIVTDETVTYEMKDNNIGYISVTQFYDNTDENFIEAIDALTAQGAEGFIIDLRDNPGGLLTSVVNMCDYIMPKGNIVTTKDKNGYIIKEYNATNDHTVDVPIVVLINGNSASASEIFAGAMKDTGKATLVGTTSFGKGIVQSVIPLSDGSAIKITIAKYFTPAGNDIHEIGVAPDYEVELVDRTNAVNIEYEDDLQLKRAENVMIELLGK